MKNGKKMNALFTVAIVLLVIAVFMLNAVALALSNRYPLAADLTANAAYQIGDETRAVLDGLNKQVNIDVLAPEDSFSGESYLVQVKHILEQYPRSSSMVSLRYIDYSSDPSYAASHSDLTLTDGDLLVSAEGRIKQVPLNTMFNYTYTADGSMAIESSRAEEAVTAAIMNVVSGEQLKIAVLTGSGEKDMPNFTALLVNNNYILETAVPAVDDLSGYDALLLLAPQTDLSEDDVRSLDAYLYNDGNYGRTLFYAASADQTELPNLERFLAEWGVAVDDGAVFETKAERTYQYQPYCPVADYSEEKYRDMLIDSTAPILMPMSRPLEALFESRDNQYTEVLLSFGETAGVRPSDAGGNFDPDTAEKSGPMPAMILASRRVYENGAVAKQSNIVVTGSVSMLDELCLQNMSVANSSYLVNIFNELCGKEAGIAIAPKSLSGKTLGITSAQVTRLGVILGGVLPLCILLAGAAVWLYRRYK